jgi:hypothetical protein
MATGKTNAKHIRVLVDDNTPTAQDVSASVSNISGVGLTYAEQDVTAYSDGVVNFTLGHPSSEIEISGPISNTASSGSHTVFSAIAGDQTTTHTVTVRIGIRAVPTTGDPEFEGEYYCSSYVVNGDGTYTARMVPASATAPAWGSV